MEYEKRAMIAAEDKYVFSNSTQISAQTGLIGHLRADFDSNGFGFFTTWFDWNPNLKTPEFKHEFDDVINSLREEGDIFENRNALAKYCYANPQSKISGATDQYGVRVDTDKYAYLIRMNPAKRDYNIYVYCYVKAWLNQHLQKSARGIRFIKSDYTELFRIPDGAKIKIKYSSGEEAVETCRYIDEYHVEIGENIFHICEFAERMEYGGHTYEMLKD